MQPKRLFPVSTFMALLNIVW